MMIWGLVPMIERIDVEDEDADSGHHSFARGQSSPFGSTIQR